MASLAIVHLLAITLNWDVEADLCLEDDKNLIIKTGILTVLLLLARAHSAKYWVSAVWLAGILC